MSDTQQADEHLSPLQIVPTWTFDGGHLTKFFDGEDVDVVPRSRRR